MIIGVPKEIKNNEFRVALLPVGVHMLRKDGHRVIVQQGAGAGSGYSDEDYLSQGAELAPNAKSVYDSAEMIVKVKEPQAGEIELMRKDQIVFCYFHFAASRELTEGCLESGITAIAYETLEDKNGRLPLLTPMSEVAGRMSVQEGARCLENPQGGRGILLSGVPGVEPANVLILGGGVVGSSAARVAAGCGAKVVVMDINIDRLRHLEEVMPANVTPIFCDPHAVARYAPWADLVIGAVLVPGRRAPVLLSREILKSMKSGAVIVDVAIDQGGCCETSRPTSHQDPTYVVEDIVHYCVTNLPGAVSRTSSAALCNATLPYCREIARDGADAFIQRSPGRQAALNMRAGKIEYAAVAEAFNEIDCVREISDLASLPVEDRGAEAAP